MNDLLAVAVVVIVVIIFLGTVVYFLTVTEDRRDTQNLDPFLRRELSAIQTHLDEINERLPIKIRATVSWYGGPFHGRLCASGVRFNKRKHMCAHKKLPFGTVVWFKCGDYASWAVVADRGPFIPGRDFDVSELVAEELHIIQVGVSQMDAHIFLPGTYTEGTGQGGK